MVPVLTNDVLSGSDGSEKRILWTNELTCGKCELEVCENAWGDDDCCSMVAARSCDKLVHRACAKACEMC